MREAELQKAVIALARVLGYHIAHFRPARTKDGGWVTPVAADGKGFPDLVMVSKANVLFVELKSEKGRLSAEQAIWIGKLEAAGMTVRVWRPADWLDGTIEHTLKAFT